MTSVTDPKAHTTVYTYDGNDQVLTLKAPDTGTTVHTYYDDGALKTTKSPRGFSTTYAYDPAGRASTVTDPLARKQTRTYTADGQPATDVSARANAGTTPATGTITYTWDDAGRPKTTAYGDGAPTLTYGYDTASRLTSAGDAAGTQTYTYDPVGRTTKIARGAAAWSYAYNDDGTIKTSTRPDASVETYTYDGAARPKTTLTPVGTTTYTFDDASPLLSSALPNATTETQTWDRTGNLSKIATTKAGTTLVSQTLTRDAGNNPTQIVVNRGTGAETRSFAYDLNDRLQGVCYTASTACTGSGAATQWWTYDLDGNRKTEKNGTSTGTTTTYTYDTANQLTSHQVGTAAAVVSTYDADGNNLTDGTTPWAYDLNNRVRSSTVGTSTTAWQRDGEGNLLKQSTGTAITTYAWDLLGAVPKLGATTGGHNATYRYDPLGRAGTVSNGTTHATFAHDPLGAPTDVISSTGAIGRSKDWTPFGTPRTPIGAPTPTGIDTRISYAGLPVTAISGTYLTRDRIYNPTTARWTATDPLTPNPGTTFDSTYTYVANQPGVYTDPLGQSGCLWWALQCGGAWNDIGQATLGVGDVVWQLAQQAAQPAPLTGIQIATGLRDAYRTEGLGYAINQLNPVYHLLEDYSSMWDAGNAGCVRDASAAGTRGALDAASIAILGAGGAVPMAEQATGQLFTRSGTARSVAFVDPARLGIRLAGQDISRGHAFEKHVIQRGEYPGTRTRSQFSSLIQDVVKDGEIRPLSNGRIAYWKDGTVVIRNVNSKDGGTAFRPKDGYSYFQSLT